MFTCYVNVKLRLNALQTQNSSLILKMCLTFQAAFSEGKMP